jgi:hypothetical protein
VFDGGIYCILGFCGLAGLFRCILPVYSKGALRFFNKFPYKKRKEKEKKKK